MLKRIIIILCCFVFTACDERGDKPIPKKYLGQNYIGAKYIENPLGEGQGSNLDSDPLIRTDGFDCVTFFETALSGGDLEKLTKMRYNNGKVDFVSRNHFFETDWLNNNPDILENISDKIAKTRVRHIIVDKQSWMLKTHKIKAKFSKNYANIKYVPYKELLETHINNDSPLVIAFIVNNPKLAKQIGSDIGVNHIGFLLPNGKLRHASIESGRVIDVDFDKYIIERSKSATNLGVAFFKINENNK